MRVTILSLIGGVVITLLTGLLPNMPTPLLGASHYGYPLAWLVRLILAPEYFPWHVDALALIVDVLIWTLIVGAVVILWIRIKHK